MSIKAFYKTGSRIYHYLSGQYRTHLISSKLKRQYAIQKKLLPCDADMIREETLSFIEMMRCEQTIDTNEHRWNHYFSPSAKAPIVYASVFAALTYSLVGFPDEVKDRDKKDWAEYINRHQCDDGLFRDPAIECSFADSSSWWGWQHLTLHALMALTALGQTTPKELGFVKKFYDPDFLRNWLDTRLWDSEPSNVSNEVQNIGVALQYSRDFHHDVQAKNVLDALFDWLDSNQNADNGSWGNYACISCQKRRNSETIMTGYHIWLLYFYDNRPIKYTEQIIDLLLKTQNKMGGFGVQLNSSACEDIDSIDPLSRFLRITEYRKNEIMNKLAKGFPWVLVNRNVDGGYVFRRNEAIKIGPEGRWSSKVNESAMFPTWFRTLTLAYLFTAMPETFIQDSPFYFMRCPGHQFF